LILSGRAVAVASETSKAAKAQARVRPALGRIILSICIGDQAN
jgi:hypothetical protein